MSGAFPFWPIDKQSERLRFFYPAYTLDTLHPIPLLFA